MIHVSFRPYGTAFPEKRKMCGSAQMRKTAECGRIGKKRKGAEI